MNARHVVVGVALLALAGCGSSGGETAKTGPPVTPTPATTTAPAGPSAFLTFARHANFGTKDLSSATDAQLLDVANLACDEGFGVGLPFGRVVQGYVQTDAKPSTAEAESFTRSAVTNLCPQYAAQLP